MVKIKGLKGIRPIRELVSRVASRPYDVLNSEEARVEAEGNPYSFLHVVKSEIDLPEDTDHYDESVYLKASENLQTMIKNGWLIQDNTDCVYVYRQIMNGHEQYGLVVDASVEDYLDGKIRIHELTREVKEKDRINHIKYTDANTGPVFLTYHAHETIDGIVNNIVKNKPEYDFTADDGIRHTVWVVDNPAIQKLLIDQFSQIPFTYVADGHHRSKSAAMVGEMRRKDNPDHTGAEEYNWFLTVLFPHNQLKILDYNRVVKDLNGLNDQGFIQKIREKFDFSRVCCHGSAKPESANTFGMYLNRQWYVLKAKPGTFDLNDPVDSLDVSILTDNILAPILGIGDLRKDERIDFVGGIRGLGELEKRVNSGEMAVAFALYPVSIKQLMAIADAGKIMPPKTTWFEPKLRSGLVTHSLD
ncbi:MAG: DUF1015 domain-containing protein [Candidatus Marinimicrobia bacterium]|nr:DUF1015 domain-containing protein [Candidatus Neomarinimicrobiota bacterium]MBL7068091.1 DUF1015 domain-containing protein [Candidatus Neomarinimicrobiota bacterium]